MPADYPVSWSRWTAPGRLIVFTLAATSIGCLLAEFYGLCSMRTFTFFISIPALVILAAMTGADCQRGTADWGRGVLIRGSQGFKAIIPLMPFNSMCVFLPESLPTSAFP